MTRLMLARLITETLAPAPVAATLLLIVTWHSTGSITETLSWGLLAVVCAAGIPSVYIVAGVWRRRVTDRHVGLREQRPVPLLVAMASVLVGGVLLALGHAPRDLLALILAMAVGLGSSLVVTLAWKISIHVAVIAGAVVILVVVFGPVWLVLITLVAAVGWARVVLGDHTPAQSCAGALLGATVAASVFSFLR